MFRLAARDVRTSRSLRGAAVPRRADPPILSAVAADPLHGYAIAQRLEQASRGVVQVPEGSLYPALHRLENRGMLAANWKKTETGREAKFYQLTRKGRKQLEAEAASWQRLSEAVGLILAMDGAVR